MISVNLVLVAYFLLLLGTIFTHGFYSFGGVIILIGVFVVLMSLYGGEVEQDAKRAKVNDSCHLLTLLLVLSTALSLLLYGGLYQVGDYSFFHIYVSKLLLSVAFLISIFYLKKNDFQSIIAKHKFGILMAIFVIVHILMIISSPDPKIDIFRSLKYGTSSLLSLRNPYQEIFPSLYGDKLLNYFSYFPSILYYFLPFNAVLGDPRYGIIFAQLATVLLLYRVFGASGIKEPLRQVFVLLFLYYPLSSYITEQSFVDAVIILGMTALLYVFRLFSKESKYVPIIVMFLMNTKQLFFFLLPIFLLKGGVFRKLKECIKAYVVGLLFVMPFLVWSWYDFVYDTIIIYFEPPQGVSADLSLNLRALLVNFFQFKLDSSLFLVLIFFLLFFVLYKTNRTTTGFFQGVSFFVFGFFLFGTIAYLNHYYLAGGLLLLYAASLLLDYYDGRPAKT